MDVRLFPSLCTGTLKLKPKLKLEILKLSRLRFTSGDLYLGPFYITVPPPGAAAFAVRSVSLSLVNRPCNAVLYSNPGTAAAAAAMTTTAPRLALGWITVSWLADVDADDERPT